LNRVDKLFQLEMECCHWYVIITYNSKTNYKKIFRNDNKYNVNDPKPGH